METAVFNHQWESNFNTGRATLKQPNEASLRNYGTAEEEREREKQTQTCRPREDQPFANIAFHFHASRASRCLSIQGMRNDFETE